LTTDKFPDKSIELPVPWHWRNIDLTKQLHREINEGHVLFNKTLVTIARRQDNDDTIFEIMNDEYKYAVVHLTWSQIKLKSIEYPLTKLYKDWKDLFNNRIMVDHRNIGII
jgi:hypothetical protein